MDAKKRLTRAIIVGDLQHKTLTAVSTENFFTGHSNIQISKNEKVNRKAI